MNTPLRTTLVAGFGLLSVAVLAGPVSCAAIVGADEYQVGAAPGTAGTGIGAGGSPVGAGGKDGTGGGDNTGGTHLGTGGGRDLDASVPDVLVKKEASIDPMVSDASRSDAVVVDTGKPMPLGSGESTCTTTCTGAGLHCVHTTWGPTGLCLYGCPVSNSECDSNHSCIHAKDPAVGLDYSCLKNCPTGVCPAGMVCLPLSTVSICEPQDWFAKDLGLGDDCFFDAQCKSGQCVNKPNGWCSRPCVAFDLCPHDPIDDRNFYGEYNWCVNVLGGYKCAPGCTVDNTVCATAYPGTTCKRVIDIDGFDPNVCSL